MPETWFRIEWPDGQMTRCYSPSAVVRDYLSAGEHLTVDAVLARSREALDHASRRVEEKFGYQCTRTAAQLDEILERARCFDTTQTVRIVDIEAPGRARSQGGENEG